MIFPDTTWTVLAEATMNGGEVERAALGKLCERYWKPVASVMRARGVPADRVEDLTQDFFVKLIEGGFFRRAERERGKFRSFLMHALKNFLADDARRTMAEKRGGQFERVELKDDVWLVEDDEMRFDFAWAETLFDAAVEEVGLWVKERRGEREWLALRGFLTGTGPTLDYRELGGLMDMSEGGAKAEVSRMRAKFREHLRREVGKTVGAPHEVDEELAYLKELIVQGAGRGDV
jgi:RNA polymerase sigma factor (sigma-70 family)